MRAHYDARDDLPYRITPVAVALTPGWLTYDLRLPGTLRYRPTAEGLRIAAFLSHVSARVLTPGLAQVLPQVPPSNTALRRAFNRLGAATRHFVEDVLVA